MSKLISKKTILAMGLCISACGILTLSPVGYIPTVWWACVIGLVLVGAGNASCIIPSVPLLTE